MDWHRPEVWPIYQAGLAYARTASSLAGQMEGCDPQIAWMGGLLAPLGWLAMSAIDATSAEGETMRILGSMSLPS